MSTERANLIEVEVAYARPAEQKIIPVKIAAGATVEQAIAQSSVLQQFPEIDLRLNKVGVFGKLCKLTAVLRAGDRVEIYRALLADPKEVRKQRAAQDKPAHKGGSYSEASES